MAYFARPQSRNAAVKIVIPTSEEEKVVSPSKKKGHVNSKTKAAYIIILRSQPGSPPLQAAIPAQAVNAPIFIPKAATSFGGSLSGASSPPPVFVPRSLTSPPPAPTPPPAPPPDTPSSQYEDYENDPYDPHGRDEEQSIDDLTNQMQELNGSYYGSQDGHYDYDAHLDHSGYYLPPQPTFTRQPLNYHLYTQPHPDTFTHNYFINDDLREELQKRSEITRTAAPPGLNLPEELSGYHTLVPLEPIGGDRRKFGNWYSTVYRATNENTGVALALRRIENYRLMHQAAFGAIETWSRIRHPNIVSVNEAFTSRAFNDNSLVVAYEYHPNAQTLYEAHLKPKAPTFQNGRLQVQSTVVPERTMWTYIVQIANAMKAVHDMGLAVRMIDATKVLLTGKNSSCGVVDVLMYDTRQDLAVLQQEDLAMFGRLVFALCCNNLAAMNSVPKAIETLGRQYSGDMKNVALFLISKPGPHKTVGQLFDMIGSRLLTEMDESLNAVDRLESELMSELENARLVRLLCKFGFINERPEFAREPRWSETGDRYIIKLFRDFVFHQVDELGNPVVNLSHVLTCLSKLDAGIEERIMLVSRDEQSCLVVSYKEVKSCIDSAFSDLARASTMR
ncbi:hypothetical protein HWV62_1354 [Athelia sp. TMB]|nr:hypothetical protein HWV62_1354 [Athelia sp. TMB]